MALSIRKPIGSALVLSSLSFVPAGSLAATATDPTVTFKLGALSAALENTGVSATVIFKFKDDTNVSNGRLIVESTFINTTGSVAYPSFGATDSTFTGFAFGAPTNYTPAPGASRPVALPKLSSNPAGLSGAFDTLTGTGGSSIATPGGFSFGYAIDNDGDFRAGAPEGVRNGQSYTTSYTLSTPSLSTTAQEAQVDFLSYYQVPNNANLFAGRFQGIDGLPSGVSDSDTLFGGTVIPLPPAVWLLGSGMAALFLGGRLKSRRANA